MVYIRFAKHFLAVTLNYERFLVTASSFPVLNFPCLQDEMLDKSQQVSSVTQEIALPRIIHFKS
jgi:hypothetical protein